MITTGLKVKKETQSFILSVEVTEDQEQRVCLWLMGLGCIRNGRNQPLSCVNVSTLCLVNGKLEISLPPAAIHTHTHLCKPFHPLCSRVRLFSLYPVFV